MKVKQFAVIANQAVSVCVGVLFDETVGLESATVEKFLSGVVSGGEFHPALIKISLFRHQVMANLLVLDYHLDGDGFTCKQAEILPLQGGNKPFFSRLALADGKNVYGQVVLQEIFRYFHLLRIAIKKRYGSIRARPAVGSNLMILSCVVGGGQYPGHVTSLAGGCGFFLVEGKRRLARP